MSAGNRHVAKVGHLVKANTQQKKWKGVQDSCKCLYAQEKAQIIIYGYLFELSILKTMYILAFIITKYINIFLPTENPLKD